MNTLGLALLRGNNHHLLLPVPRSIAGVVVLSHVHQEVAEGRWAVSRLSVLTYEHLNDQ